MPRPEKTPPSDADLIEQVPLSDELRGLARRGVVKRFAKGELLIREGDLGQTLYIILSGQIRAFTHDAVREKRFTFGEYGPGEFIGEMSLDGGKRSASVEAIGPVEAVIITRQNLLEYLKVCPEFALQLLSRVIWRARTATLTAKQLALLDVYGRLRLFLHERARPSRDGGSFIVEKMPTHAKLAESIGTSRENVTRLLNDLLAKRLIGLNDGTLSMKAPLPPQPD